MRPAFVAAIPEVASARRASWHAQCVGVEGVNAASKRLASLCDRSLSLDETTQSKEGHGPFSASKDFGAPFGSCGGAEAAGNGARWPARPAPQDSANRVGVPGGAGVCRHAFLRVSNAGRADPAADAIGRSARRLGAPGGKSE